VNASNGESLPRRFGVYLLTSFLGEDVLGRVYRAIRLAPERVFTRVRIFEATDISEDAVLDAIEENGEIHTFLKNPAITRGVDLDAVDGTPFLAWNEESGRTLDGVIVRVRESRQTIPYEHALLIAEKVATALDHAYNTTVDGERTVHGLVWPGFVSISDDGETRLTGFGLAEGFLPSLGRPRFAKEIAPYLAHEEKASGKVGKNSDVYSVGAILFELLAGRLPNAADPLADLKTVRRDGAPLAPEPAAVLRMCLGQASDRFQSSGELRRELGKLLFSGPYAPSTFNLAFFLNGLFGAEIDSENESRVREAALDPGGFGPAPPMPEPPEPDPLPPRIQTPPGYVQPHRPDEPAYVRDRTPPRGMPGPRVTRPLSAPPPRRRVPFAIGGALLVLAAVVGGAWVVLRRQNPPVAVAPPVRPTAVPVAPTEPPAPPTPVKPTNAMTDTQFKDEVARRVSQELKRMEQDMRKSAAAAAPAGPAAAKPKGEPAAAATGRTETAATAPAAGSKTETPASAASAGTAGRPAPVEPTAVPVERDPGAGASTAPRQSPSPPSDAPAESAAVDTPPKILRIIKPVYPAVALRAGLKGTVILRVSVSETGRVTDIQVLKSVPGGLTDSAVTAVRGWRFEAATRAGVAVPGVITIPIPFEP
jgi:protein TonB